MIHLHFLPLSLSFLSSSPRHQHWSRCGWSDWSLQATVRYLGQCGERGLTHGLHWVSGSHTGAYTGARFPFSCHIYYSAGNWVDSHALKGFQEIVKIRICFGQLCLTFDLQLWFWCLVLWELLQLVFHFNFNQFFWQFYCRLFWVVLNETVSL